MAKKAQTFQVPAGIVGLSPLKDGSMSIRFHTQEMTNQKKLQLLNFFQSVGWLMFRENEFNETDVPKEDAPESGKTQSQRLRGVIFKYWIQHFSDKEKDFEKFYKRHTEKIIDQYKAKLEPDINR